MAEQVTAAPQGQATAPTGQGASAQAQTAPTSQGASSQSGSPFWKTKTPDGKELVFNSPDELDKTFKESYFARKDYTQKTMKHADEVKKFQE